MISPYNFFIYTSSFIGLYASIFFLLTLIENRHQIYKPLIKKNYPKIAILVPCYNEEATMAATINSLLELDYPKEKLQIIIIDDGSTDKTFQIAKSFENKGPVKAYHKENGGKYTALNYGLKKTKAELVGTLDADSFVDPQALKKMVPYFSDPNTQAVTSSLKVYKPKTILQHVQNIEYLFGIFLRKSLAFLGSIQVTPGPLTLFRKSVFDKIGPYRHAYNTEDLEICLRLQSHNYHIENSIDASVYTVAPANFKALYLQRVRWYQGLIRNGWDYRHLLSKKHGNLGLFTLPLTFLGIVFLFINGAFFIWKAITTIIKDINLWSSVGFDWSQLKPKPDWFFIDPNTIIFIGILTALLTIIAIYVGYKLSKDHSPLGRGIILSAILYGPLYAIWWLGALLKVMLNKEASWAKNKAKQYRQEYGQP